MEKNKATEDCIRKLLSDCNHRLAKTWRDYHEINERLDGANVPISLDRMSSRLAGQIDALQDVVPKIESLLNTATCEVWEEPRSPQDATGSTAEKAEMKRVAIDELEGLTGAIEANGYKLEGILESLSSLVESNERITKTIRQNIGLISELSLKHWAQQQASVAHLGREPSVDVTVESEDDLDLNAPLDGQHPLIDEYERASERASAVLAKLREKGYSI